jgi:uncharacterized protein (TIGR02246 family)
MTRSAGILLILLATTVGCQASRTADEGDSPDDTAATRADGPWEDAAADEQALRELADRWEDEAAAKDSVAIAGHYTTDGVFIVPYEKPHRGTAAIQSAWGRLLTYPNASLTWEADDLKVAESGDLAYERGTYQLSFSTPHGPVNDSGSFVIVWEKRDGEWKAAVDIVSTEVFPGPPTDDAGAPEAGAAPPD